MNPLTWMAWTSVTAWFFILIACGILTMTVWEIRRPTASRKGLLPFPTTRGDRFFIILLLSAFVHMFSLGFLGISWPGSLLSLLLVWPVARWA